MTYKFKIKLIIILFLINIIIIGQGILIKAFDEHFYENEKLETINIPIIMYHRVTVCYSENRFEISPVALENDLKYLAEHGYRTLIMKDLIDFVYNGVDIPKKSVILSFDDGNYSDYKYLYPLLKKYEMKAVISIIGRPTELYSKDERKNINFPNLVAKQIKEMYNDNVCEFQNHSYNLHSKNGSAKLYYESSEEYKKRFKADIIKMQDYMTSTFNITPTTFTYPLGKISKESQEVLEEIGILSSLSCYEGINKLQYGEYDSLYQLKRYIRTPKRSIANILVKAE